LVFFSDAVFAIAITNATGLRAVVVRVWNILDVPISG
jgi:hypothetical protein